MCVLQLADAGIKEVMFGDLPGGTTWIVIKFPTIEVVVVFRCRVLKVGSRWRSCENFMKTFSVEGTCCISTPHFSLVDQTHSVFSSCSSLLEIRGFVDQTIVQTAPCLCDEVKLYVRSSINALNVTSPQRRNEGVTSPHCFEHTTAKRIKYICYPVLLLHSVIHVEYW